MVLGPRVREIRRAQKAWEEGLPVVQLVIVGSALARLGGSGAVEALAFATLDLDDAGVVHLHFQGAETQAAELTDQLTFGLSELCEEVCGHGGVVGLCGSPDVSSTTARGVIANVGGEEAGSPARASSADATHSAEVGDVAGMQIEVQHVPSRDGGFGVMARGQKKPPRHGCGGGLRPTL